MHIGRRRLLAGLAVTAGAYGVACVLARAVYPRLLYPAFLGAVGTGDPAGGALLELPSRGGRTVRALAFGAPAADVGRTFLFFHGNNETADDSVGLAGELVRRGHRAIVAEYTGYGRSKGEGSPSERVLYEDAEALLEHLRGAKGGASPIVLMGRSLGTGVAAEMSMRGHGRGLVLLSPYTSIDDVGAHYVPFLPVRALLSDHFATLRKAPAIRVPTLVVHGTADEVIPFAMGTKVAGAIAGARLLTIEGGTHNDLFARAGSRIFDALAALTART
jgi:pimeloyl-ACP methyl ester carboxylesterase